MYFTAKIFLSPAYLLFFFKYCDIITIMSNKKNQNKTNKQTEKVANDKQTVEVIDDEKFKKIIAKRNFYNVHDAGMVFLWVLLLPILISFAFTYIGYGIATAVGITFQEGQNFAEILLENYLWFSIPYALITQIVFACVFFIYNKVHRIKFSASKFKINKKIKPIPAVLCAVFGIVFVIGLFGLIEGCFGKLFEIWGVTSSSNPIPLDNFGWYVLWLLLFALIPAFFEELIFRGVIFNGLKRGIGSLGAIFLSSLLFALMHQSLNQFIYPFVMGCIFALVLNKTNNLVYPFLMHLFNNITTITIQYLENVGAINVAGLAINWVYILVSIILALVVGALFFLFYWFYLRKQEFEPHVEEGEEFSDSKPMMLWKLPVTIYVGIVISVLILVINLVAG